MPALTASIVEPWDFEDVVGTSRLVVESLGFVRGPDATNWSARSLLLRTSTPFMWHGETVDFLVANPRYEGLTIERLEHEGGVVGMARVRPGVDVLLSGSYVAADVEYIIIGRLDPTPSAQTGNVHAI